MTILKYISPILLLIILLGSLIYFHQERLLFFPDKLPAGYKYTFPYQFKEFFFNVDKKTSLNGLLCKADSSKGLVFYLHGNAGCLDSWGQIAGVYLQHHYDFFILDYRGYGKSQGKISGEEKFLNDIQIVYDSVKADYNEKNIVIIGYSIGTGPATWLASANHPKLLILQAPYFNMPDLARHYFKIIPSFMVRYKFRTDRYITCVKCPVIIFHGNRDEVIYTGSSYKLKKLFKSDDSLIILEGQKHNGINDNEMYQEELKHRLK